MWPLTARKLLIFFLLPDKLAPRQGPKVWQQNSKKNRRENYNLMRIKYSLSLVQLRGWTKDFGETEKKKAFFGRSPGNQTKEGSPPLF